MKCSKDGCAGNISMHREIQVSTGCSKIKLAYPCQDCSRLHWKDGKPASVGSGRTLYLGDSVLVMKNASGDFMGVYATI